MKPLFAFVILLLSTLDSKAQKLPWFLDRDTTHKYSIMYIYMIPEKGEIVSNQYNVKIKDIDSLRIYSGDGAADLYGEEARKGVVVIWCKRKIKLIPLTPLDSVLSIFKINTGDLKLPVYVDSVLVYHKNETYLDLKKIKSVKVETEFVSDIQFINILTTEPSRKPKHGEIWIRGL